MTCRTEPAPCWATKRGHIYFYFYTNVRHDDKRVLVPTVKDKERLSPSAANGDRVADLLAKISRNDGARCFGDPLWTGNGKFARNLFSPAGVRNCPARRQHPHLRGVAGICGFAESFGTEY